VQDRVTQLLEYLPDLVTCFDAGLRCTYVNRAVEQVSGSSRGELRGKSCADLFGPSHIGRIWEGALRRVFESATVERLEVPADWSGIERQYQTVLIPQPLDCGRVDSVLVVAHDVTERNRAARERERDREELAAQLRVHERRLTELLERMLTRAPTATAPRPTDDQHQVLLKITLHERELLKQVAQGRSNTEIGRHVGLSPGTVRNQLTQLYLKLGVTDRTHAAARAVALGLIPLEA
jgi:PAS domain S-box-containing protein